MYVCLSPDPTLERVLYLQRQEIEAGASESQIELEYGRKDRRKKRMSRGMKWPNRSFKKHKACCLTSLGRRAVAEGCD